MLQKPGLFLWSPVCTDGCTGAFEQGGDGAKAICRRDGAGPSCKWNNKGVDTSWLPCCCETLGVDLMHRAMIALPCQLRRFPSMRIGPFTKSGTLLTWSQVHIRTQASRACCMVDIHVVVSNASCRWRALTSIASACGGESSTFHCALRGGRSLSNPPSSPEVIL